MDFQNLHKDKSKTQILSKCKLWFNLHHGWVMQDPREWRIRNQSKSNQNAQTSAPRVLGTKSEVLKAKETKCSQAKDPYSLSLEWVFSQNKNGKYQNLTCDLKSLSTWKQDTLLVCNKHRELQRPRDSKKLVMAGIAGSRWNGSWDWNAKTDDANLHFQEKMAQKTQERVALYAKICCYWL